MAFGNPDHARGKDVKKADENESYNGHHQQVWQLGAHEFLDVRRPFVQYPAHKAAFGKDARPQSKQVQCVHPKSPFHYLYLQRPAKVSPLRRFQKGRLSLANGEPPEKTHATQGGIAEMT